MSRQFRYRVTAIVLGGLIFGAPLLTNGTASAEQVDEGGRQVVFEGGGVLGLSCRSRPDVESMVVPAESTVRVVNRTGYSAKLQLDGDTKGVLPDDASTEVVFRRGTTPVLLKPNCALGDNSVPVLVTTAPSAPASMPDPIPVPSGDAGTPMAPTSGSDAPAGPASGMTLPDTMAAATRPTGITPAAGQSATRGLGALRGSAATRAAATAVQGMPQGGGATRAKIKNNATGTPGSTVPAFAGMPPGDGRALLPRVRGLGLEPATQQAAPAAPAAPPTEIAAAEPVAAMESVPESGPIGMLALIAAVCVMGVGAAAIRAIVSQRANRAKVA
jgi:hypothetical protein